MLICIHLLYVHFIYNVYKYKYKLLELCKNIEEEVGATANCASSRSSSL